MHMPYLFEHNIQKKVKQELCEQEHFIPNIDEIISRVSQSMIMLAIN